MENEKNLDLALEIVSKLITGVCISGREGDYVQLYQAYENSGEVFQLVQAILKKMNLSLYTYNDGLYVSAGENNQVFGFRNDELKKAIGVRLNRELYLCYFIIYNVITRFYTDSGSYTFTEYITVEDIIAAVDTSLASVISSLEMWVENEVEENSFKTLAMMWEDMPAATGEESTPARAARNSKAGYVKMVLNFMVSQGLLLEVQERYYPKERMKALTEHYFEEHGARLHKIMEANSSIQGKEEENAPY